MFNNYVPMLMHMIDMGPNSIDQETALGIYYQTTAVSAYNSYIEQKPCSTTTHLVLSCNGGM